MMAVYFSAIQIHPMKTTNTNFGLIILHMLSSTVVEILVLLGCYVALIGSWIPEGQGQAIGPICEGPSRPCIILTYSMEQSPS
jgi:hypothetical protein